MLLFLPEAAIVKVYYSILFVFSFYNHFKARSKRMGDIIATIVLCVTFLIMFLLLFRYFLTGFLAKRANKEEDLKAFYGGPFQKIPAGLAQAVLRQFCINEQVAVAEFETTVISYFVARSVTVSVPSVLVIV